MPGLIDTLSKFMRDIRFGAAAHNRGFGAALRCLSHGLDQHIFYNF
jgi:hypothetical protein